MCKVIATLILKIDYDFLRKMQKVNAWRLETGLNSCFGKSLILMFLGQNRLEMGPLRGFSKFIKWMHEIFLIFCMKLQCYEELKLTDDLLGKILFWSFWAKRDWNEFFMFNGKSVHWVRLIFYIMIQQLKG